MAGRVHYKGYVLVAAPYRAADGRWVAKVIIEEETWNQIGAVAREIGVSL